MLRAEPRRSHLSSTANRQADLQPEKRVQMLQALELLRRKDGLGFLSLFHHAIVTQTGVKSPLLWMRS